MQMLLASGIYHAIATHDAGDDPGDHRVRPLPAGSPRSGFEFQMLYGIRRDLQQSLAADGLQRPHLCALWARWYPYFMRRLAERPANVLFIARNLFRG